SRCPVARSISSPLSASIRLTDAPTVPSPSSATPTSTADMCLRAEQALDAGELAELLADALDLRRARVPLRAQLGELRPARLVVAEELLGEDAARDLLEDLAHPLARAVVDDARPAGEVAELGDVRHGVAHVLVAALAEEVDAEAQLVEATVVRDLGLVARLDERVEARLHEGGYAPAEHRLLAEE